MKTKNFSELPLAERLLWLLDAAVGWGLITGAALASFVGNLVLAGILVAVAAGVFIRLYRKGRRS